MNDNLYFILGISIDADIAIIKKAYRDLCKIHHPDLSSGSHEFFLKIQLAYDILSNDIKRKLYDETGVIDESNTINVELKSVQILVELFGMVIEERLSRYSITWSKFNNLISVIKDKIISRINHVESEIKENNKLKQYLEKEIKKIKCKDEHKNIFNIVLNKKIIDINKVNLDRDNHITVLKKALEMLSDYTYQDEILKIQTESMFSILSNAAADEDLKNMPIDEFLDDLKKVEKETK